MFQPLLDNTNATVGIGYPLKIFQLNYVWPRPTCEQHKWLSV